MKRNRSSLGLIFLIALMVGLLAFFNRGVNKNMQTDSEDDDSQAAQTDKKPAPALPAASAVADPIPAEVTIGDPATAKYKVTLGWVYDAATEANPTMLQTILTNIQQQVVATNNKTPNVLFLECVNLDLPDGERSPAGRGVTDLGLTVTGKSGAAVSGKPIVLPGNPGEGPLSNPMPYISTLGPLR